ncbi:hypothetical protein M501DRAFT_1041603, partial [Patellaria atrata CBS 101060]
AKICSHKKCCDRRIHNSETQNSHPKGESYSLQRLNAIPISPPSLHINHSKPDSNNNTKNRNRNNTPTPKTQSHTKNPDIVQYRALRTLKQLTKQAPNRPNNLLPPRPLPPLLPLRRRSRTPSPHNPLRERNFPLARSRFRLHTIPLHTRGTDPRTRSRPSLIRILNPLPPPQHKRARRTTPVPDANLGVGIVNRYLPIRILPIHNPPSPSILVISHTPIPLLRPLHTPIPHPVPRDGKRIVRLEEVQGIRVGPCCFGIETPEPGVQGV